MGETGSPRILLVRLSAIGDVIHALPVLCALRGAFPRAFLAWVTEPGGAEIVRGHPALDRLVVAPRGFLKQPSALLSLRRDLRSLDCGIVLDPQGLFKSALLGWLSGAKRRIGFAGDDAREMSGCFYTERVAARATHVIDRNLELLAPLGVWPSPPRFDLPRDDAAEARIDAWIEDAGLAGGFAVVNPGAGWPSKRWPPERYGAVARALRASHGLSTVVVWAGEAERRLAEAVRDAAGEEAARLAPPTTLRELAALLRRARLCIGSDTGPVHLAAASGTPCVALYGPMPKERNGPYGSGHEALQAVRLEGTKRERRAASAEAMEAIAVDEAVAACGRVLDGTRPNDADESEPC